MVSPLNTDIVANPTRSLLELYDPGSPLDGFPEAVARHFSDIFKTQHAFDEIPVLDVRNPPECHSDRTLVRFRAMVQDTSASPELYLATRRGARPGGWGMTLDACEQEDVDYSDLRERVTLWAVSVPGESAWCSEVASGPTIGRVRRVHKPPQPHKFPIQGAPHIGVQIKVYDTLSIDSVKATDIRTFVGILASEPLDVESDDSVEVPTLHVLFSRAVTPTLVPRPYPVASDDKARTRERMLTWIAEEALGGDREAAEWVLLMSLARVQSRATQMLPPSLTLSRFPSRPTSGTGISIQTPTLSHIFCLLFPLILTVPLTLPLLNTTSFAPESMKEDLHSGLLQVPAGTRLILTECGIQEGKVTEKGIMNIRTTQEVITSQTIRYKFPFSEFPFPTDVSFLVLSEGSKSAFFKTSVTIPLQRKDDNVDLYKSLEKVRIPDDATLQKWRALVGGALVGTGSVTVGEQMSKYIQEEFVSERQKNRGITGEDLALQMALAKLMALSLHQREVTREIWGMVKALDDRKRRLAPP